MISDAQAPAAPALRNVYSCEQFAAEILCNQRTVQWVQFMCRARRIRFVARRPYLIPQSEAVRFVTGGK